MAKDKLSGLMLNGTLKKSGVTFYHRNGQLIVRSSHSNEKRSNTRAQFNARMRMKHTIALWQKMNHCDLMFLGRKSTYAGFASLANRLPVVYASAGATLLMPGIPVSDGPMTPIVQRLDTVEGTPALVTNLKKSALQRGEYLKLYTLFQDTQGNTPTVSFTERRLATSDFATVDGCLALKGDEFANDMMGWALVLVNGDRCSTQAVVTRCTYYERFTTEEAFEKAVERYGGLTK